MIAQWYEDLIRRRIPAFVVEPDGRIAGAGEYSPIRHIVSGSFNPLHEAHKALFYTIGAQPKAFEISIVRYNKDRLGLHELQERLRQFAWYAPVVVTNSWRYEGKAKGVGVPDATFHVGYDTALRLLETEMPEWLDGTRLRFVVYQRQREGTICTVRNLPYLPKSFQEGVLPGGLETVSSSQIRGQEGPVR